MLKKYIGFCIALILLNHYTSTAQDFLNNFEKKVKIDYIDHNGNGIKDQYEDSGFSIESRIIDLIRKMTLEEKVGQMQQPVQFSVMTNGILDTIKAIEVVQKQGVGSFLRVPTKLTPENQARVVSWLQDLALGTRLGIPLLFGDNCTYGYADMEGASVFPGGLGMASTWEPGLVEETARVTAEESTAVGVYWNYNPYLNIARDPRWGRIGETFGEDTYLTSILGFHQVIGYQGSDLSDSKTMLATAKVFLGNGVSERGINGNVVDMSERKMRKYFLPAFTAAVNAGVGSIMGAHNEINGIPSHAHNLLYTKVLRQELGFDGVVVSDYSDIEFLYSKMHVAGSVAEAGKLSLEAGFDVDMIGNWKGDPGFGKGLIDLVKAGYISEKNIDEAVSNFLRAKFRLGLFDRDLRIDPEWATKTVQESQKKHRKLALESASKSIILLKNENKLLPLVCDELKRIAVIGPNANSKACLFGMKYHNWRTHMFSVLEGLRNECKDLEFIHVAAKDTSEFQEAIDASKDADVVILVLGESAVSRITQQEIVDNLVTVGEGVDRAHLRLPEKQEQLMKQISSSGKPVVLVILSGGPLAIPCAYENIPAIVQAWGPGEEGGNAIAKTLIGKLNPGGKLPVTIPGSVAQIPIYYNNTHHKDGRGFIDESMEPAFYFGHGLSYTSFEYKNLKILNSDGPLGIIKIQFEITNTGNLYGDEVAQLYINDNIATVVPPVKELKGFLRIGVEPGETKKVVFELPGQLLAIYDRYMNYVIEPGDFTVMIGSSSDDIRLRETISLHSGSEVNPSLTFFTKAKFEE
jgi:beta-glucosidase